MIKDIIEELINSSTISDTFKSHLKKQVEKIPEDLLFQVFDREVDRLDLTTKKLEIEEELPKIEKELLEINRLHKDIVKRYEKAKNSFDEEIENIKKESKEEVSKIGRKIQDELDSQKIEEIRSSLQEKEPQEEKTEQKSNE